MHEKFPNISKAYYVCSDTIGSVFTASSLGGMVLIAGTGSNALLRNPDGATYGCGGWGSYLADESSGMGETALNTAATIDQTKLMSSSPSSLSAYWISHRAVKTVFDDLDGLNKSPHDTAAVWRQIKAYFNVDTQNDLLEHCYAKFDKAFFAGLCAKLAQMAADGDRLAISLFDDAGRYLAKSTAALLPKVNAQLVVNNSFNIVCVGSVFKSWPLMKNGFVNEISKSNIDFGLNLIHLTTPMAMGAVYVAADSIQCNLPRDYAHNFEIFYHHPTPGKAQLLSNTFTNGISNGVANKRS